VVEVVDDGQAKATTKSGKEMTKEGTKDNPAVVVKTASSGSQGIKKVSCLHAAEVRNCAELYFFFTDLRVKRC
jgi:hypothetical protein